MSKSQCPSNPALQQVKSDAGPQRRKTESWNRDYNDRMTLNGKAALVTGASKGVGKGIALELARAGSDVAVNYNTDRAGADSYRRRNRGSGA